MNQEWVQLMEQMPILLGDLTSQPLRPPENQGILPTKGIYVFYEDSKPIYTGRTRNMRRRLSEHCAPSSRHMSATFAFTIAKREATKVGININMKRDQLEADPAFGEFFRKAKERISRMPVRAIEINDPVIQTLFEVYASLTLGTREFNDFDTH